MVRETIVFASMVQPPPTPPPSSPVELPSLSDVGDVIASLSVLDYQPWFKFLGCQSSNSRNKSRMQPSEHPVSA